MPEPEKPTPDPEKPQLAIQEAPPEGEKPPDEPAKEPEKPHELEPGGDRFKQVWARAKKAEEEARAEREARIAAEARAKALEETKKADEKPKRYTAEQVQKAVEAGQITQAEAMDYVAETKAQAAAEAVERRRLERERAERPVSEAQREMADYLEAKPGLRDKSDPKFNEVARVYQELTGRYGMADNLVTEVLALRQVYGPASGLRASREVREMTREAADLHAETAAGGGTGGKGGNNADPLAKVPKRYVEFWTKRGFSRDEMVKEAKYLTEEQLKRK